MKDTVRIILYRIALKHLHKALNPGQVYAFSYELENAGVSRIDKYMARFIAYDPGDMIKALKWRDTEDGENYWRMADNRWQQYLEQHIEEIDDEVRKVLS